MNITKSEQKQLDRARAMGRGALLRTMAIVHRSGSTRTQNAIEKTIVESNLSNEFIWRNGAMLYCSEA